MNTKFKFYFHKELYVPLPEINPPSRKNTQRKIQGPTLRRETIHRGKSRDQLTVEKEYIEENPGTNPPSRNNIQAMAGKTIYFLDFREMTRHGHLTGWAQYDGPTGPGWLKESYVPDGPRRLP